MKKIFIFIVLIYPLISFSQLTIVISTNLTPLYPVDGDTLSACRNDTIIFEADVFDGATPVTNASYYWDFDDGTGEIGTDKDSVMHIYINDLSKPYQGGGGFRVKLKVIDLSLQEGFIIIPIRIAVPPNYKDTKADLKEGQLGICKSSSIDLLGVAFPDIWEDEPVYEVIELTPSVVSSANTYESTLVFDEFPLNSTFSSGNIDSIGLTLQHADMGNLELTLTCENGSSVILKSVDVTNHSSLGEPSNNIPYTYYWSASSVSGIMNSNLSDPIPESDYIPEQSFDNLIGCQLNGDWKLTVEDFQAADDGLIYSWSLIFEESVLPNKWTFRDTLVVYKKVASVIIGSTNWSGNIAGLTNVVSVLDTIKGNSLAIPQLPGNNVFHYNVITDWGCIQDTLIGVLVEKAAFTATPNEGEAKLDVRFENTTSWAEERDWDFGDKSPKVLVVDSDTIKHQYLEKGDFEAILIVTDENGCQDTDTLLIEVRVEPSKLENLPTMFSPGGGDINEVYKISEESLQGMEEFLMIIYNRWGEIVYKTDSMDEIINVGWNGKIRIGKKNNAGLMAAPGVYYYVIRASAKDGITEYKGRNSKKNPDPNVITSETKGTIRLFR